MSVVGNTALQFSEEQAMLLDVAREFCRDKSPISSVRAQLETEAGFDQAVWDEMVALGWTGIALPESCGGSGMGVATVVPVVESMGRAMLGTPLISTTLAGQLLLRSGALLRWSRCWQKSPQVLPPAWHCWKMEIGAMSACPVIWTITASCRGQKICGECRGSHAVCSGMCSTRAPRRWHWCARSSCRRAPYARVR